MEASHTCTTLDQRSHQEFRIELCNECLLLLCESSARSPSGSEPARVTQGLNRLKEKEIDQTGERKAPRFACELRHRQFADRSCVRAFVCLRASVVASG